MVQIFNAIAMRGVSAQTRPETALLRSINAPGSLLLLEQNFDYDLLSPAKILERYVGKGVTIIKTNPKTGGDWHILSESVKHTKVNSRLTQRKIKGAYWR